MRSVFSGCLAAIAALSFAAGCATMSQEADMASEAISADRSTDLADPATLDPAALGASIADPNAAPPAALAQAAQVRTPAPPQPDADMQRVLDALMQLNPPPIGSVSPAEQRAAPTPADAVRQVLAASGVPAEEGPALEVANVTYPGAGGPVPARIYRPAGATQGLPVIVYFHGGGWVIANLDVYDASARALARSTGAIVVSASYRQAPEHKFPAAHEDAIAAYRWALANAQSWGGDASRVAVAGESAGGNLALNVSMAARAEGLQAPLHQLLIYPVAGVDTRTESYTRNAAAMPLSRAGMLWFFHYAGSGPADLQDPRLNVLAADLSNLPPTTIIAAEIDPLTSEGVVLAERLSAAGTEVERRQFDGATHEFFGMAPVVADATEAQAYAATRLRAALGVREN